MDDFFDIIEGLLNNGTPLSSSFCNIDGVFIKFKESGWRVLWNHSGTSDDPMRYARLVLHDELKDPDLIEAIVQREVVHSIGFGEDYLYATLHDIKMKEYQVNIPMEEVENIYFVPSIVIKVK